MYAGLPSISGGIPPSSLPQDPIFTTTSAPPPVTERVNNTYIETDTGLPSVALDPINDSNALSEARLVDIDKLDFGLSLISWQRLLIGHCSRYAFPFSFPDDLSFKRAILIHFPLQCLNT